MDPNHTENKTENTSPPSVQASSGDLKESVISVLQGIYDPEIPVDIYELGLVYNINIDDNKFVNIDMTLTSPACPVAGSLPPEVETKVAAIRGVMGAKVNLVWEPPWDKERMSEAARLKLNLF